MSPVGDTKSPTAPVSMVQDFLLALTDPLRQTKVD